MRGRISCTMPEARALILVVDGVRYRLCPQTHALIELLLLRRGQFCPRAELLELLYPDPDLEPDEAAKVLDVHIWTLRQILPAGTVELRRTRRSPYHLPGCCYRLRLEHELEPDTGPAVWPWRMSAHTIGKARLAPRKSRPCNTPPLEAGEEAQRAAEAPAPAARIAGQP